MMTRRSARVSVGRSLLRLGLRRLWRGPVVAIALVATLGLVAQTAAAQSPSDREIAKAGVLQADDFPAGWRAIPPVKTTKNCPAP